MENSNESEKSRRSSRVELNLPVLVTSSGAGSHFSEVCETLVVNAHGCAMRSPTKLEVGAPVHLHVKEGRQTMAHVVDCQPIGTDHQGWRIGARLDRPDNFWGLKPCPEDWINMLPATSKKQVPSKETASNESIDHLQSQVGTSLKVVLDKIQKQLSDDRLRAMIAEVVDPLQAEVEQLKERRVPSESGRSRFEVSLSHIPPEVEDKLWLRLRHDLGAQVAQQTREHAEQVLESSRVAIQQKITEGQDDFRQRVAQELQAVEQRSRGLSDEICQGMRQHLRTALEEFQQQVSEAEARLQQQREESLRASQQRLREEHDARRREIEQMQAAVTSEWSRLQTQIADLDGRMATLNESVRRLESDLESRLAQVASDIVAAARTQLQSSVDVALKDLTARNAKELQVQLDEACVQLNRMQNSVEASVSGLLDSKVAENLKSFENTMELLAQESVGRWRGALARNLSEVARVLSEQFRIDSGSER